MSSLGVETVGCPNEGDFHGSIARFFPAKAATQTNLTKVFYRQRLHSADELDHDDLKKKKPLLKRLFIWQFCKTKKKCNARTRRICMATNDDHGRTPTRRVSRLRLRSA
jgi:hypothetical protein